MGREDLAVRLEHADDHEDLELAVQGDGVPLLRGGEPGLEAAVRQDLVRARDELRRAGHVAEERGHRNAAVLDLRVAEVADRALVAEAPEVAVGEAERVPEAHRLAERVRVRHGERLELRLRVERRRRLRRDGRDVRRGAGEREGGDDLLPARGFLR